MPLHNFVLMILVGMIFGGVSGVFMRSNKVDFFVNVALGVVGAALGGFLPVLLGDTTTVGVGGTGYLIRALMGSFVLIVAAGLFRSARPG